MPFGLNLFSVLVGVFAAWFVIPWIQGMFYRNRTPAQPTV